jgi:flagellin-like hook-associated protein FlgL
LDVKKLGGNIYRIRKGKLERLEKEISRLKEEVISMKNDSGNYLFSLKKHDEPILPSIEEEVVEVYA